MAAIQGIRKHGKLLIAVIGIALLAFITEEFFRATEAQRNQNSGVVGTIYGKKIHSQEYSQLIEAYNGMVAKVGQLMREQEAQKEEARRLEINALQNQINPHFLYNTLDAVNWMAKMDLPEQVETLIRNLSDFYRLCLSGGKDYITWAS